MDKMTTIKVNKKIKENYFLITLISVFLTIAIVFLCVCIGAVDISIKDVINVIAHKIFNIKLDNAIKASTVTIIWNIRFPRILLSGLVGGALSISGAAYQGLLKNPMADPYVIGVSSGAAFGAAVAIVSGITFSFLGLSFVSIMAFICALIVMLLVYFISKIKNKIPVTVLLLSGIAVGNFLTAFTSLIMLFSKNNMEKIFYWTMGSFSGKSWTQFISILPYIFIGALIMFYYAKDLNIMLLGEDSANNLGVDTEKIKIIILVVSTIVTAISVSVSGIIGFVGLIVPHITRMFVGPDNRKLLPLSFIWGAILMILCDTIARSILEQELPVGLVTAILGGPFFIYLLRMKKKEINFD